MQQPFGFCGRLVARVGLPHAKLLTLTGRQVDAPAALELRLVVVHRVREEAAGGFGADELAKVDRARVGGDGDKAFPHMSQERNQAPRAHISEYREYFDATSRAAIEKHFAADLAAFGYSFDGGTLWPPGPDVFRLPAVVRP